jgi:hypothetical protein
VHDRAGIRRRLQRHLVVPAALLIASTALAAWTNPINTPVWRLSSPPGTFRWLEIHNLDDARSTGIYHVQVLERSANSPPWEFRSLADHMAITAMGIRASIQGVASEKAVYPETFNTAYRAWKKLEARGEAPVCNLEVAKCLR